MKTVIRVLAILVVVAAVGGGGFWLYQTRLAPMADAASDGFSQVVAVQRGDLSASLSVVGELYAVQQEDLYFDRASGTTTLLTLDVEAGHVVQAGQPLATIDPSPYQQALDQAKSDLQEAEEVLADLQTPATELEIAQADLAIARARLNVRQAQEDLDDLLDPDIADLQSDVAGARLDLVEAQADLSDLEADSTTADKLYDLREQEAERSAEYTRLANETYSDAYYQDRLRTAYNVLLDARDAVARAETQAEISLLNARTRVWRAEENLQAAQDALAEAQAGVDDLDLARAKMAIAEAEVALAAAQEKRSELDEGVDAVKLAAARATVDKRRLAVAVAEADLQAATIRAPFAGTVLDTGAEWGDLVNSNSRILTIANLDSLQVRALVDETTIRQIEVGQAAVITFDAFLGQQLRGQVLAVPLQGTLQGGVMVYEVPVLLQGAEELPLLVGMTANVAIQVGQVQDALLVPAMALQNVGGFYQVLVPDRDPQAAPQAVPVEVGLSDGLYTEIVRGLNEGDQVVVQLQASDSTEFGFGAIRGLMGGGQPGGQQPPRQ
ncbi:MAG: HlyD family efflux transporter periplasmic adaptor subunit [Chloroflexi bacterium]|nr:HlyD family efflux transporter periplasmic adaptor subunit [Chloroflexota bacterium]